MIIFFRTAGDSASNRSTLLGQNGKIDLKLKLDLFPSYNTLVFDTPFPFPFCFPPPTPPTMKNQKGKADNLLLNSPDLMLDWLHVKLNGTSWL